MGWLKKVGLVLGQITSAVVGIGPLVTALTPSKKDDAALAVITDTLGQVAGIVTTVEVMGQALSQPIPGVDKLKMATPLVAQVILQSSILAKHKIADAERFKTGCSQIASGMAEVLSSLQDKVEAENRLA